MRTNAGSRPELLNPASVFEIICTINQSFLLASDEDLVSLSPFFDIAKKFSSKTTQKRHAASFFSVKSFSVQ